MTDTDLALESALGRESVGPADFARRLLERGELARTRGPLRRVKIRGAGGPAPKASDPHAKPLAQRIEFLKDATVKGALRWLVRSGGWRVRQVVAGKRRREGRVWAQGIWEALAVGYSPAALEVLAAVAQLCQGERPVLPAAPELSGLAPGTTGDLLVFHMALDALLEATPLPVEPPPRPAEPKPETPAPPGTRTARAGAAKKPSASTAPTPAATPAPAPGQPSASSRIAHLERRRALIALSPLTAAFRADELLAGDKQGASRNTAAIFAPLVAGDRAVLLTYLDDALAIRWIEREVARRAIPAVDAGGAYLDAAAALEAFIGAALAAARPDALRPVLRFFERYLVKFGQREAVALSFKNHAQTLVRASDRSRFLGQVARLFAVSRLIAAESERILGTPFVDRSEEEKVFVADVSDFVRGVHPELEAIRRELAGEVG